MPDENEDKTQLHIPPTPTSDDAKTDSTLPQVGEQISLWHDGPLEAQVTAHNTDGSVSVLTDHCELQLDVPEDPDQLEYRAAVMVGDYYKQSF